MLKIENKPYWVVPGGDQIENKEFNKKVKDLIEIKDMCLNA